MDIHCIAKVWDEEDWNDDEPDTPVKGEPNTLYIRKSKRRYIRYVYIYIGDMYVYLYIYIM